jgi:hypothetical protein
MNKAFLKNLFLLLLTVNFYLISFQVSGQEKKAFKLLEKKNYPSLIELLTKEIKEDTLNPGIYYIYSLLYSDSQFEGYNIDSAYKYVLPATQLDSLIDEKTNTRLINEGITPIDIKYQKSRIESLAFDRAKAANTPESYNYFLQNFPSADQVSQALELRDNIAFEMTEKNNTYEAYLTFVKNYPSARQVPEAQSRYDDLIYKDFTRDENLESYERFAAGFPTSGHWEEAVKNIFLISTQYNDPQSYISFIKNYPFSKYSRIAFSYLHYSANETTWIFNYKPDDLPFLDSLKTLIRLDSLTIFPVFENNAFGFIGQDGRTIIPPQFQNIDPSCLCGDIKDKFLVVSDDSVKYIIARNGQVIYRQNFYNVENIGLGFLKLSRDSKYGVIHQSGLEVLPFKYSDAGLVGGRFIKALTDKGWYIFTFTGKQIDTGPFDNISDEGNFIIIEKSGRQFVTTSEKLSQNIREGKFDPQFDYDNAELVDNDILLCSSGNKECILDSQLEIRIPLMQQEIFSHLSGWLVKRDSLTDIYNKNFQKVSGTGLKKLNFKGNWITGIRDNKSFLYYNFSPFPDDAGFDSVNLINENFTYVISGIRQQIIFSNRSVIQLENYKGFEILKQAIVSGDEHFPEYLLLKKNPPEKEIWSSSGTRLFSGKYDFLQSLGYSYFLIKKGEKFGLIDSTGKIIVKTTYDGMANYQSGFITTLNGKFFGLINPGKGLEIPPRFVSSPERYNDSYFVFREGNQVGLMDQQGRPFAGISGDQVLFWNDTSCLVRSGDTWSIRAILTGQILFDDMSSYKKLFDSEGEIFYLVKRQNFFGILSDKNGLIINCSFTDVLNIGNKNRPVYFAEKYIPEAEMYIVIYYSGKKEVIRKQVFTPGEYSKIYCR